MTRFGILALAALAAGLLWAPGPRPPVAEPAAAPTPPPPGYLAQFGDARLRHPAPVKSLALTPDGKLLATTAGTEPVIRLWDVATAWLVREVRIDVGDMAVSVRGFTPDGQRMLIGIHTRNSFERPSLDYEPATLDLTTGAVTRWGWTVAYHFGLTIAPDGRTVAGWNWSGRMGAWDLMTGRQIRAYDEPPGSAGHFWSVGFSPDGTQLAVCYEKAEVYVTATDGSRPWRRIPIDSTGVGVRAVIWPRSDRLIALWYNGLAALDPATGQQLTRADLGGNMTAGPWMVAGDTLYVRSEPYKDIAAVDLATLARIPGRTFPGGGGGPFGDAPFAVSADGRTLAVAVGHAVRLYDAATGVSRHPDLDRYPTEPAYDLQFSADGRRMLSAGGRTAKTWNLPGGRMLATFDQTFVFRASAPWILSPDGRRTAGGRVPDGRLVVRDAATGDDLFREPGEGDARGWLAVGFAGNDRLWARDLRTANLTTIDLAGRPVGPAFRYDFGTYYAITSPDGRRLAVGGWNTLAVRGADPAARWHVLAHYPERHPSCGFDVPHEPRPLAFSADGRRLLVLDGGYALWDVTGTPVLVGRFENKTRWPQWRQIATFSPDGRRLAGTSKEKDGKTSVRVWEAASVAELVRLDVPSGASACAFTPAGRRLIVAHLDTTFSVWDYTALEAKALAPKAGDAWTGLADPDPKVGLAAVRDLAADPNTIRLFREKFTAPDPALINRLIAELDSPAFAAREAASRELAALGEVVEPALRSAAKDSPSAEVRQRAGMLLRRLYPIDGGRSAARLRAARAVEVLDRVGTPEAAALAREWAADRRMPVLAAEAEAAAARLAGR
ncbi:MAG TPA: hypothetical protein VFG68_18720 [Fimbriiglobus sp.]|nr:hypothetical protein [Fimbriiglobus sp.]